MGVSASLAVKDSNHGKLVSSHGRPYSPIPDDVLNTKLELSSSNLLVSSPVLERVTGPVPPVPPVRTIGESLNLLANTCSDLVTNMFLQHKIDAIETEKEDRTNQSWANLSNAAQCRPIDIVQAAPPGLGLSKTLPLQQTSQPLQPITVLPPVTVADLREMPRLQQQAATMQVTLQQQNNVTR